MKLQEALNKSGKNKYIARRKWYESGSDMRLLTSAKVIEELNVSLTEESFFADDWEIYEMKE